MSKNVEVYFMIKVGDLFLENTKIASGLTLSKYESKAVKFHSKEYNPNDLSSTILDIKTKLEKMGINNAEIIRKKIVTSIEYEEMTVSLHISNEGMKCRMKVKEEDGIENGGE